MGIISMGKVPNFLTNTVLLTVAILSARIREVFLSPVNILFGVVPFGEACFC
jgi:hypothetical protein